ncbi:unnamed protein product [Pleuronectes platessa]|uniref:Zinc finger, C3HC-type containing 1 n=1 Tax=Pleuronectes platessa TaxID=8262 RepID=A0A9N7YUB2_PLEPL|nr:unnamed protein product [Pleuronectes platessa]
MATLSGSRGDRLSNSNHQKASLVSPEKVREILNQGVSSTTGGSIRSVWARTCVYTLLCFLNVLTCGAALIRGATRLYNRSSLHAVYMRGVGTFSRTSDNECDSSLAEHCLKWAGKPRTLSPLMCARYGWINIGCDMLKCSSCNAFLCATLQPTLDLEKYESRITEILRQLQTQHEKFCPWPDFPCPERFWLVPACEPSTLLTAFLERFQSACLLAQQLPAMKPEQLKSMSLTEDVISAILQLVEEEQKKKGGTQCSESLGVQVAACIVSLCGWAGSPTLHAMNLPILTCSYCMRKVGLWNFHQMEATGGDGDSITGEGNSSPVGLRSRSRDSPSPIEEQPSPLTRGKRSATRGKGLGDTSAPDGAASPPQPLKRLRLSSVGGADDLLHRNTFDPLAQHRDWCPWISVGKENVHPGTIRFLDGGSALHQQGWKAALDLLMPMKKNSDTAGGSPAQARLNI